MRIDLGGNLVDDAIGVVSQILAAESPAHSTGSRAGHRPVIGPALYRQASILFGYIRQQISHIVCDRGGHSDCDLPVILQDSVAAAGRRLKTSRDGIEAMRE